MLRRAAFLLAAPSLAALAATAGAGETTRDGRPIPEAVRRACRDDAFRLCPGQVALMNRAGVRACLDAKADRLSPTCRDAIRPATPAPDPADGRTREP